MTIHVGRGGEIEISFGGLGIGGFRHSYWDVVRPFSILAFEHLRSTLTRGNLWIYVLSELQKGAATPGALRSQVQKVHGFSPAAITFYSVLYKLRREGLVERSSDSFRSSYGITPKGRVELQSALGLLRDTREGLERSAEAS